MGSWTLVAGRVDAPRGVGTLTTTCPITCGFTFAWPIGQQRIAPLGGACAASPQIGYSNVFTSRHEVTKLTASQFGPHGFARVSDQPHGVGAFESGPICIAANRATVDRSGSDRTGSAKSHRTERSTQRVAHTQRIA